MGFLSGIGKALGKVHHEIRGVAETPLKSLPGGDKIIKLHDKGDKLAEKALPVVAGAVAGYFTGGAGAEAGYALGKQMQSGLREAREEREAKEAEAEQLASEQTQRARASKQSMRRTA